MPLPHFLMMLALSMLAAALTIWAASSAGLPMAALAIMALAAAAVVGLAGKER